MKKKIRHILTFICALSAAISSIVIICTFLTTYQFLYIGQMFNSYFTMQLWICITMALWGIRFFFFQKGKEKYTYSGICALITIIFIFFMINLVK